MNIQFSRIFQPAKTLLADMRVAAKIVTNVLLELEELTKPGVSLDMLDELAERRIRESGGIPYNKGYKPDWAVKPFPATVCCSVNHEAMHATPRGRYLKEGDIITYDLGVKYKTGCGDAAITVAVGRIDNQKQRVMRYALRTLYAGINAVKTDVPISELGRVMENEASKNGYAVIKEAGSHHIGRKMHEKPDIPNIYDSDYDKYLLKEGAIICLEPHITPGNSFMRLSKHDMWTFFTVDEKPVAMYEHMMIVGKNEVEILTKHIKII